MGTRKEFYEVLREKKSHSRYLQKNHLTDHFCSKLGILEAKGETRDAVFKIADRFCVELFSRLDKVFRNHNKFQRKYDYWLQVKILVKKPAIQSQGGKGGRPTRNFQDIFQISKLRKTGDLRSSTGTDELLYAAQMKLRSEGQNAAAKVVKQINELSSETSKAVIKVLQQPASQQNTFTPYTSNEALSMIVSNKLSKSQYSSLRSGAKDRGVDLYPTYNKVLEAKRKCYPPPDSIFVNDKMAEVNLQALLNHTTCRLLELCDPVLKTLSDYNKNNLVLISKWGFDVSSGQSQYKQKVANIDADTFDDSNFL